MELNLTHELAALRRLTPRELCARYAEAFGEQPSTKNRGWLLKRLAWRLQSLAEGDLSQRARQRAAELANDADLRTTAPRAARARPGAGPGGDGGGAAAAPARGQPPARARHRPDAEVQGRPAAGARAPERLRVQRPRLPLAQRRR